MYECEKGGEDFFRTVATVRNKWMNVQLLLPSNSSMKQKISLFSNTNKIQCNPVIKALGTKCFRVSFGSIRVFGDWIR